MNVLASLARQQNTDHRLTSTSPSFIFIPFPVGRMLRPTAAAAVSPSSYCALSPRILAFPVRRHRAGVSVRCATSDASDISKAKLKVGSPVVIVKEPPMLKTAASVPSLRQNAGRVKPGDVGRIMARKPKDVWAVRLAVGTYLLDGKHFKPLDVVDDNNDDQPQDG